MRNRKHWQWGIGVLLVLNVAYFTAIGPDDSNENARNAFILGCQNHVKRVMKFPDTAVFSPIRASDLDRTVRGYLWSGAVEAGDEAGVMKPIYFRCKGPPDRETVIFSEKPF